MASSSEGSSPTPGGTAEPPDDEILVEEGVERDPSGRYVRFEQVLGRGAFKTVFKGFDEEEGIEVAWNQVKVSELVSSKEERDRLFAEIRVLKQLKHKNIMTFYDSWLDPKSCTVNFITELFTSGTLRRYRKRHKHIDEEVLKRWAWQILCGLVYLHGHQPPIIHRDLKCDNIFVNGCEGVVKIGDLGLATLLRARTTLSVLGTPEFMAPELYDEDYDDRVDVYSYGMCLLELATMEYPYSECKNAAQIYKKVTNGIRPVGLQKVESRELQEFIMLCISENQNRPRARQLLKHMYFDSIRGEKSIKTVLSSTTVTATSSNGVATTRPPSAATSPVGGAPADGAPPVADGGSIAGTATPTSSAAGVMDEIYQELVGLEGEGSPPPGSVRAGRAQAAQAAATAAAAAAASSSPPRDAQGATAQAATPFEDPEGYPEGLGGDTRPLSPMSMRSHRSLDSFAGLEAVNSVSETGCKFSMCRLVESEERVNLRLRIQQPEGPVKTVEFDFDRFSDTAMGIATEMVEDLSLSQEDARCIASAIRAVLARTASADAAAAAATSPPAAAAAQRQPSSADAHASTAAWVAASEPGGLSAGLASHSASAPMLAQDRGANGRLPHDAETSSASPCLPPAASLPNEQLLLASAADAGILPTAASLPCEKLLLAAAASAGFSSAPEASRVLGAASPPEVASPARAPMAVDVLVDLPPALPSSVSSASPHQRVLHERVDQRLNLETGAALLHLDGGYSVLKVAPALLAGANGAECAGPGGAGVNGASPGRCAAANGGAPIVRRGSKTEVDKEQLRKTAATKANDLQLKYLESLDATPGTSMSGLGCKAKGPPMLATRAALATHATHP